MKIRLLVMSCLFIAAHCARLGEASVTLSELKALPAQPIITGVTKPGMGASGGPLTWSFWAKNRQATSDAMLGSFVPFYKVSAIRLSVSAHFVFYRDVADGAINSTQADAVLATMENAYANLKTVYGGGEHPYANDGARIVILAYNIIDDYSTTQNYVGGYFSPRDLYSNDFTQALFTDPVALQQYSNLIGILGGYSNEMSLVNYDLNPGYSTNAAQVNDIVIHELSHLFTYSRRVFQERLVNHDLWIAEGIAENAPHQTIQTSNVQQLRLTQLASPSTIDFYQDAPQLTDFLTWASKIVGYLQSNLFFNYLRHRAEVQSVGNSATLLTQLMTASAKDIDGIDSVIQTYIPGATFASIYSDFVTSHYLMMLGIPLPATNAINGTGTNLNVIYSFSNVNIGNSASTVGGTINGKTINAKYSDTIPFNFEAPKCADGSYGLKPNSYFIFRYKLGGNIVPPNVAGSTPVAGELPLKYVVNLASETNLISASPPTTVSLLMADAPNALNVSSGGYGLSGNDVVHVIVINPNKTGSCRLLDNSLVLKRNHSKWVGYNGFGTQASPDYDWQTDTGATWNNSQNGAFYRPGGIATFAAGLNNNFIYVVDYVNMSLQKLNMDTGAALGRLGDTATSCPTSDAGWNFTGTRFQNNYCAHSFDSPQGVHVDSAHNIYIADSNNRRIVRYDANGNFNGWLGLNGASPNDQWQLAANVTDGATLASAGAQSDPKMFYLPWAVATDPADATYLYISDYGSRRIVRRNRSTGAYAGFIGNGKTAWDTTTMTQNADSGSTDGYFGPGSYGPRGIVITGGNLYVADEGNHRIARIDVATGNFTGWLGGGGAGWQLMSVSTPGVGQNLIRHFQNPSDVGTDGTNLYIADRLNNRIVKWSVAGTFVGWIGHGKIKWETTAASPTTDPYAGFSLYPPDYYAEPHAIAVAMNIPLGKNTKRDYIYLTSVYNGRVTRINLGCVNAPGSSECDPIYDPLVP